MIINLISGPRNISTALMYSFAQRPDTHVMDEPFYGEYLLRFKPGHPGEAIILASVESDLEKIKANIEAKGREHPVVFLKNMGHHLLDMDVDFLLGYTNVFLTREPGRLIASLAQILPEPTLRDTGLKRQAELFDFLTEKTGVVPIVIDSDDVLVNPAAMLRKICEKLGIPYTDAMLTWKKGKIYSNAPWARWWYKNVTNTTGFEKQSTSNRPFPERLLPLLEEAKPYAEKLRKHAIKSS